MNLYLYFYYMMIFSLMMLMGSLYLYFMDFSIMLEWLMYEYNSVNMEFLILVDWISCLFMSVVMMISAMIMIYIMVYMQDDINIERFSLLVILFILSMLLMIMSPNLISIMFGWDGLGLSSYCLVIYYQNYLSYNSGMVTVLCNRMGDVGLLMSIGLIFMYGSWNMLFELELNQNLIISFIVLAAMTKSAQIPFSVWLPMAMAAPTPVSALVHSSTLVTAGVYLLIRFNSFLVKVSKISEVLLFLSIMTMFMAGLMANFEIDLKKIIALSTLSQLGLMMMILSVGEFFLAFFHLLTHAVFKSLLFMCAGIMIHCMNDNQDIRFYGKLNEFLPFTMMSFYISSLALMGFPFLAGFYSKDLILEVIYMMKFNLFYLMMILFSIMFTVSYTLRLMFYTYYSKMKGVSMFNLKENLLLSISMIILVNLSMFSGSFFFWLFFFDMSFSYLSIKIKILTFMCLGLGIIFSGYIYMKNFIGMYMLVYFLSSMWMMNLMYMWIYKPFIIMGLKGMMVDKEWGEFLGKGMMLNFISKMKMNINLYKIYMFMMIMMIWIFFFFILY